ncbi:hypothetical protein THARTR1_04716 [Trichoderma harzianum]|uniref:Uncharacterized protein n=1 Tax=Trichoderma harzianum TaxID=5544 RepID=A0A2K0UB79_TRIHA|nr:hypothetical protein THARTR1_04716 [Trichoderma harzianum]
MPARDLLPLIAVLQLCKVEMAGDSLYNVTRQLIKCRVLELAQASVKHFSDYKDKIVRTNHFLPHREQMAAEAEIPDEVEVYEFW